MLIGTIDSSSIADGRAAPAGLAGAGYVGGERENGPYLDGFFRYAKADVHSPRFWRHDSSRARAKTASSIGCVSLPVNVFCCEGW